jgi:[lysine-biosynthesis-protein LysW]---L-2-aminoadipate ligase
LTEAPIGAASDAESTRALDDWRMAIAALTPTHPRLGGDLSSPIELTAIVGWEQQTNCELADEWLKRGIPAVRLTPPEAASLLGPGDTALVRLDVLPTLDGIEEGLDESAGLGSRGVRVLNSRQALVAAHDKLVTARRLVAARIPHPKSVLLPREGAPLGLRPPLVLKPRFGSWGQDVFRCETEREIEAVIRGVRHRPWFRQHGALLQELVPSTGRDIRLLVANGRVVGGAQRVAPPGEWRTNVSLGAVRLPVHPPPELTGLAVAAAAAIGADFVGVDLLPLDDGCTVIELNGAVEFDRSYDLDGQDVYEQLARALGVPQATFAPVR